jgi:carboxypeptidase Q
MTRISSAEYSEYTHRNAEISAYSRLPPVHPRIMRRLSALLMILSASLADAQTPKPTRPGAEGIAPADTSVSARVMREVKDHQLALGDLEHLTDVIGPRLTGSDRLVRAHAWAESTLVARGFTNVHRESYEFGPSWTRGATSARLLTQNGASLSLAGLAWGPSTPGLVRGDVMRLEGRTRADLEALIGHFKGRIIIPGNMPSAGDDTAGYRALREKLARAIRDEGALAFLLYAGKGEGLNVTGGPFWRLGTYIPQVPVAFLADKDFTLIQRSMARGERVTLAVDIEGTRSPAPVQAYNSIAELRGTDLSNEVVIIGAHLDSWDLGTGATDNGTGVVAAMEALRAIKATGVPPRRTIRVALFSGEEQGHWGSKAYVRTHASELSNIQAVIVNDLGTGKTRGFAMQGLEASRPFMARAIAPLNELGVNELPLERGTDSDHWSFVEAGVPGFFAIQDVVDYFSVTHHSQFDTFDRVKPDQLVQSAQALAVTAWELANMKERLPHPTPLTVP